MGRLRHEAGQTIVLVAVLLPLFLGLGALTVDIGYWYVVKKTAQDAADAAALAAARELPDEPRAREVAEKYVEANMPGADKPDIDFPYTGGDTGVGIIEEGEPDYTKIEVTVRHPTGTFFGRIFGLIEPAVIGRAVAERLGGRENLAIFAHSADCSGSPLDFAAPDVYVNGLVHANGRFRVSDGPFWAAEGTHNKPNCPSAIDSTVQSQFGESRPPPAGSACAGSPCREPNDDVYRTWPVWFTPSEFGFPNACTYTGVVIHISPGIVTVDGAPAFEGADSAVPAGSYCALKSINLDGNGLTGSITAIAPTIAINGDNQTLTPFASGVLLFAVPNTDAESDGSLAADGNPHCADDPRVTLGGGSNLWSGIVFNPCGLIEVNTGDASPDAPSLSGALIGERIEVGGSRFYMDGASGLTLPPYLALWK